jgi:hypothetical protein
MDIHKIVKAIEKDAGHSIPGLTRASTLPTSAIIS